MYFDCIYNAKVVYFPDFHPSKGRNLERNLPKLLFLLRNGQKKLRRMGGALFPFYLINFISGVAKQCDDAIGTC